jgi:hypothetical protein
MAFRMLAALSKASFEGVLGPSYSKDVPPSLSVQHQVLTLGDLEK